MRAAHSIHEFEEERNQFLKRDTIGYTESAIQTSLTNLREYPVSARHFYCFHWINTNMSSWQVNPSDVIILEGILVFHDPRVRELMNMKIFVDTGPSTSGLFCNVFQLN